MIIAPWGLGQANIQGWTSKHLELLTIHLNKTYPKEHTISKESNKVN